MLIPASFCTCRRKKARRKPGFLLRDNAPPYVTFRAALLRAGPLFLNSHGPILLILIDMRLIHW